MDNMLGFRLVFLPHTLVVGHPRGSRRITNPVSLLTSKNRRLTNISEILRPQTSQLLINLRRHIVWLDRDFGSELTGTVPNQG